MKSSLHVVGPPSNCNYLPHETAQLEYNQVQSLSAAEYMDYMLDGWRRFGRMMFRPRCRRCTSCRSIRIPTDRFAPNRSQRRAWQANHGVVRVSIGRPAVTPEKLALYDRYHAYQAVAKDWPWHPPKQADDYFSSFVDNPFPNQEWCYHLGEKLVGVGYVDDLPRGLSAIYFFYDPDERDRSLGTFNVLSQIEQARRQGLPHVYLGYFVEGCPSMEYKAKFLPNETRLPDGRWVTLRE